LLWLDQPTKKGPPPKRFFEEASSATGPIANTRLFSQAPPATRSTYVQTPRSHPRSVAGRNYSETTSINSARAADSRPPGADSPAAKIRAAVRIVSTTAHLTPSAGLISLQKQATPARLCRESREEKVKNERQRIRLSISSLATDH
jgi:hypothetical protein